MFYDNFLIFSNNIFPEMTFTFWLNKIQQQHQEGEEEHNDGKMGARSASGLEELIMGCTSSTTHHDVKDVSN